MIDTTSFPGRRGRLMPVAVASLPILWVTVPFYIPFSEKLAEFFVKLPGKNHPCICAWIELLLFILVEIAGPN